MVAVRKPRPVALSRWIEQHVCLPQGLSSEPGPIRLAPYMRAIADAITDPKLERVTVLKSARIGFSNVVAGAPPPSLTRFHRPAAAFALAPSAVPSPG